MSGSKPSLCTASIEGKERSRRKCANKNDQTKITSYFQSDRSSGASPDHDLETKPMTNGFHDNSDDGDFMEEKNTKVPNGISVPSVCTRSQSQKLKNNNYSDKSPERDNKPNIEVNGILLDRSPKGMARSASPDEDKGEIQNVSSSPGSGPTTPHKIQAPNEARLRLDSSLSPRAFNKLKIVSPKKLNFSLDGKVSKQNGTVHSTNSSNTTIPKPTTAEIAAKPSLNNALKNNNKPAMKNTQMTQYFPIRRSHRKSKTKLLMEKQKQIEEKILSGKEDGLKVECFGEKGRGVVTTRPYKKGEMVVEYVGNLIEIKEAKDKEVKYSQDVTKGCYMYYFTFQNTQYCLDATEESEYLGRLVNHSRNGNLITKAVEVAGKAHLILMAKKDIPAGIEILYDYGDRSKQALEHHPWLAF